MNMLVTGASSMIGRHVVERLIARGDAVTTLQRNPVSPSEQAVTEVLGSVTDPMNGLSPYRRWA